MKTPIASGVLLFLVFFKVHEEFINNMTNTTVESLIQKFAESKGTGKERPGKRFNITEEEMLI